jgi:hypothetical protein
VKKVICNKSKTCLASGKCIHARPHNKITIKSGSPCSRWDTCFEFPLGQETPVRCTKNKVREKSNLERIK